MKIKRRKNLFMLLILGLLLFLIIASVTFAAPSAATVAGDAFITPGAADQNFGSETFTLVQGTGTLDPSCEELYTTLLKFDVAAAEDIASATLTLQSLNPVALPPTPMTMRLFGVDDDTWDPAAVTWNSWDALMPTLIDLGSTTSTAIAGSPVVFPSSTEFASFLNNQRTGQSVGDGQATIVVKPDTCPFAQSEQQAFASSENTAGPPAPLLEIFDTNAVSLTSLEAETNIPNNFALYGILAIGVLGIGAVAFAFSRRQA